MISSLSTRAQRSESNTKKGTCQLTEKSRILTAARDDIDSIAIRITHTRESFHELMKHYMVKPKKANVGPEPRDFFDKWSSFVSEFKDLWEREGKVQLYNQSY